MEDLWDKDWVKDEERIRESRRKEEVIRINWPSQWQWWIDTFREREKVIADYKKSSTKALATKVKEDEDKRTTRPFPDTSQRVVGWLSGRKEFQLEVFGGYYTKMPIEPPRE